MAVTATVRIAPAAIKEMLTPSPIRFTPLLGWERDRRVAWRRSRERHPSNERTGRARLRAQAAFRRPSDRLAPTVRRGAIRSDGAARRGRRRDRHGCWRSIRIGCRRPRPSRRTGIGFVFWYVTIICVVDLRDRRRRRCIYSIIGSSVRRRATTPDGPPIHGHTGLEIDWTAHPVRRS